MNYTDINIEVMLVAFLAIYTLVKRASRTAMMLYVVAFNLYFAYRLNGSVMWLLPATACFNYALTQEMALREGRTRKLLLATVVVADLAVLAYFKYATFILNDVIGLMLRTNFSLGSIVLPVGISFYTFQGISHAVDVYRRRFTMNTTLLEYFFYLTFFPLLLAGPITRAENLIPRLRRNRQASSRMVWSGLWLIMLGLVKKNMVSDYIGQFTTWVFDAPQTFSGFENMAALLGYPVQIYFDFSGYSDMSIGAAAILGFWLPDNFSFPYRALSLTDFWRRWHISLSTWFRDYLYIPLGGNRKGTLRMYANNFITMLVAGLWHGASWMFVIWGALHGFGLCVHKFFSRQLRITIPSTLWGNTLSWLITYVYVCFAWSFFRSQSLTQLGTMYEKIASDFSWAYLSPFVYARPLWTVCLLGAMLTYLIPERTYTRLQLRFITLPWLAKFILFIVCVQLAIEVAQEDVQPFIYGAF
ncbi:alginate O-acetyltransferase AlgI family protein [Leyella stercorea DSM 18206]|uniref:Alginate O-acetyltransferase AlgI family protein n=1 Tax=Leyella stercorea DSM 18206 TaxID=1002367 RepID=G6AUA5_9BACT|nr:MBOAT family O-acyltransferase [Leyella stercorea]EHJ42007.1 alginate O-acetyltransferase AlgI family protein [Leyella stercorea DSM 18206]